MLRSRMPVSGVNIGCGTALDTFDDLELRTFADGQHMADEG